MSYRKLKADWLFDGYTMRHDAVLICAHDGTIEEIAPEEEVTGDLEKFRGIITPGFINCHCHLELSHLKGRMPEKQGLVNFVLSVVSQRNQTEEMIQEAILSAEAEMGRSGIVGVGDICNSADTIMQKSVSQIAYYNFIELFGFAAEKAGISYEAGKNLARLFRDGGTAENHLSLNPHAPYSLSPELWNLISPGFQGKTITIHNQESAAENEFFLSATGDLTRMYTAMKMDISQFDIPGTSSLPYFLPKLKAASRILLVHNTFMEEPDLTEALSFSENLFLCLCPNANIFIEDRLPDIPLFLKQHARVVLGTDSLASNHQLSILEEMKTIKKNFPLTPTREMLVWATSNGAKALAFEDKMGDFKKGKKPGIVLIEHDINGEIGAESTSRRIL